MRKIWIIFCFLLLGCEPTLDKDSTFEEVTETLVDNYFSNKENFARIIGLYQEDKKEEYHCFRGIDGAPDFSLSERYQEGDVDKNDVWYKKSTALCELEDETKMFLVSDTKDTWGFYTFENSEGGYLNTYFYVYRKEGFDSENYCKGKNPKKGRESGQCIIPLSENWSIDYSFGLYR